MGELSMFTNGVGPIINAGAYLYSPTKKYLYYQRITSFTIFFFKINIHKMDLIKINGLVLV